MNSKSIKLFFLILGTIMGAGFASGKEIATFFTRFGYLSIPLAIFTGFLFYYISKLYLHSGKKFKDKTFSEMSVVLFKGRAIYFDAFFVICFIVVVGSLMAGANSLGVLLFKNYQGYAIAIILGLTGGLFAIGGISSINKVNSIISPLVIVGLLSVSALSFFLVKPVNDIVFTQIMATDYIMGVGSSIIYVCLNMLLSGLILLQIGGEYNKKEINFASKAVGVAVAVIISFISLALILSNFSIFESELPMIALSININKYFAYFISSMVIFSIFTSIVATQYVVIGYVNKFVKNRLLSMLLTVPISFIISILGFSTIIKFLFPIMGVIGLLLTVIVLKQTRNDGLVNIFKSKKLNKNHIKHKEKSSTI